MTITGTKAEGARNLRHSSGTKARRSGINATISGTGVPATTGQVCDFARAEAARALNVLDEDYVVRILIGAAIGLLKLSERD